MYSIPIHELRLTLGSPAPVIRIANKAITARFFADFAPPYRTGDGQVQPVLGGAIINSKNVHLQSLVPKA
jgi:hypothetical protein